MRLLSMKQFRDPVAFLPSIRIFQCRHAAGGSDFSTEDADPIRKIRLMARPVSPSLMHIFHRRAGSGVSEWLDF